MKKLGVTLLAAAFSLPLAFGAQQQTQTTPPAHATGKKVAHKAGKKKHMSKKKQANQTAAPMATGK